MMTEHTDTGTAPVEQMDPSSRKPWHAPTIHAVTPVRETESGGFNGSPTEDAFYSGS